MLNSFLLLVMTKACVEACLPLCAVVINLYMAVFMTAIHWPLDGNDNQSRQSLQNPSY